MGEDNNAEGGDTITDGTIPWLLATLEDLAKVDIEAPLAGTNTPQCKQLHSLYEAARLAEDSAATRVFSMLAAICGMALTPQDRSSPFSALFRWNDKRSAIVSDFRDSAKVIAAMAARAKNPVLCARLADVTWLLDQKQGKLGSTAIRAYIDIIEKVISDELSVKEWCLHHDGRDYLYRALQIGHRIGRDKAETIRAKETLTKLLNDAFKHGRDIEVLEFSRLDLAFQVSDPASLGTRINQFLNASSKPQVIYGRAEFWSIAAHAFHSAKREEDKNHCLAEAAEEFVKVADAASSAMTAAHFMSEAISRLHGLPAKRERRTALCHQLVDIQARIPDELKHVSKKIDLKELITEVKAKFDNVTLFDKFFMLAALERSPDVEQLIQDAEKVIRKNPLSSLFGMTQIDREGKTISRIRSGSGLGEPDETSIQQQIAQDESFRRSLVVSSAIKPARLTMSLAHFITEDILHSVIAFSPFVPPAQRTTFAKGFHAFFQGDDVGAVYILTPLLENLLRHVLKLNGHNVVAFDDETQTQQDRTIATLFGQMRSELEAILTVDIVADLDRTFLAKPGPHIRHAVAHGLLHDNDPYAADAIYACWSIYRLCLLPLFQHMDYLREHFVGTELTQQ